MVTQYGAVGGENNLILERRELRCLVREECGEKDTEESKTASTFALNVLQNKK